MSQRIGIILVIVLAMAVCPGQDAATVAQALRADLEVVTAKRDLVAAALAERLAADAAKGALIDLHLEAHDLYRHRPLVFQVFQRGDRFYGGGAHLTSFNHGDHHVDASGLVREGDRIHGSLRVTLNPDQWVPADRQPRYQDHEIELRLEGTTASGGYRFTGELGPDADRLTGTVVPVAAVVPVAEPSAAVVVVDGLPGCIELAGHVHQAYRQLRAAALALRDHPASFEVCLARNRVPPPIWQATGGDALLAELAAYGAAVRAVAVAYQLERHDHQDFARGFVHPDDPRFGPFFEAGPLPVVAGLATLPDDAGTAGPQRWQFIADWTVTGPFPAPWREDHIEPQLPEWLPAPSARYLIQTADMPDNYIYPDWYSEGELANAFNSYQAQRWLEANGPTRPPQALVHDVPAQTQGDRWVYQVLPPRWMVAPVKVPLWGSTRSSWTARAELVVPADVELWCECAARDAGQLWIDDRLVWHSLPDLDDLKQPKYAIFPVTLSAGTHRIVLRVRNDDNQTGVRLLFCTRGRPATGGVDQRSVASGAIAYTFRGNGDGSFPAAPEGTRPPLAVDMEKGTNVRWSVAMPSYSHGYPFVVGDKIFTTSEPHWLYCFDKHTGQELWKAATSYSEFMKEADRAEAEQGWDLLATENLRKDDDPAAAQKEEKRSIDLQLRDGGESMDEKKKAELEARSDELAKEISALVGSTAPGMRTLGEYGVSAGGWHDFTGYSMATPVTDGERIWMRTSTGAVACFDLEGQRQWIADSEVTGDIPCVSSPVIIGDVLIVEGGPRKRARLAGISMEELIEGLGGLGRQDVHYAVGLDKNSGAELWATPLLCGIGGYGSAGGGRAMRLRQGEDGHLDVYVTQRFVLRAADGAVLHNATGTNPGYTGFTVGPDLLQSGSQRTLFWAESRDQVGVRHLVNGAGGWSSNGNVLAHDGWLYGNPDSGMRAGRTHVDWQDFLAVDAVSGERRHLVKPALEGVGNAYTPPAACGEYLYLIDTGAGGRGKLVTARTGTPPMILARSDLDSVCYSGAIFDGARMYLRTRRSLSCFETTTDEGRELEYERSVVELFESRAALPRIPEHVPVPDLPPVAGFVPPVGMPVSKLHERLGPPRWLAAGPFEGKEDHLAAIGGCAAAVPAAGQEVAGRSFAPLADAHVQASAGLMQDLHGREHFQSSVTIDLTGLMAAEGAGAWYFATVVEVTRPRVVRFSCGGKGIACWIAGQEVPGESLIRVGQGFYPVVIRADLGRIPPPMLKKMKVGIQPQFVEEDDPEVALAQWRQQVAPYTARLQEVLVRMPKTKWAFEAERYLISLGVRDSAR